MSGQLIGTVHEACRASFLAATTVLLEPLYLCELQATQAALDATVQAVQAKGAEYQQLQASLQQAILVGADARADATAATASLEVLGGEVAMLERYLYGAGPPSPTVLGLCSGDRFPRRMLLRKTRRSAPRARSSRLPPPAPAPPCPPPSSSRPRPAPSTRSWARSPTSSV